MKAKNKREADAMARRLARHVVGKTVARVELRPFEEEYLGTFEEREDPAHTPRIGRVFFDPCIIFTDGTRLYFTVAEADDGGDYGITPGIRTARGKRAR